MAAPEAAGAPTRAQLVRRLMAPASVALIGASGDPTKLAGRAVAYLARLKFAGAVYPITPNVDSMHGFRCHPTLDAVDGPIDCALISRPAAAVLGEVEACLRRGIRAFVVMSGGFAESGDDGGGLQARLVALCREAGAVLCGPNSAGLYYGPTRTALTLSSNLDREATDGGSIALLSNSGSIATMCFQGHGHVYRSFVATGNEAVLSVTDFMLDALDDPGIRGVVAFLETIRDPQGLREAARRAHELGKPVAILKAGRTEQGASVARSHTAALVDDDAVIDAIFEAGNLIRLRSIAELKAMAVVMHAAAGRPVGTRVGVVTPSGGTAVLIADELVAQRLALPPLSPQTATAIAQAIPDATPGNPFDVTGFGADPVLFGKAVTLIASDPGIDVLLSPMGGAVGPTAAGRGEALTRAARDSGKLVIPIWQSTTVDQPGYEALRAAGMPVLTEYDLACRCVAGLAHHARNAGHATHGIRATHEQGVRRPDGQPAARHDTAAASPALPDQALRLVGASLATGAATLDEPTVKSVLAAAGVRVPASALLRDPGDLARADAVGFPAVLKVVSADITHKSAVGGVATLLRREDLPAAAAAMRAEVARRAPGARIDGLLVEAWVIGGVELIVGVKRDARFGPVITLGLGGVLADDFAHPVTATLPLGADGARRMVERFSPTIAGSAAAQPLVDLMLRVSALAVAWGERLHVLEINPVKLTGVHGHAEAWALDGVVELGPA